MPYLDKLLSQLAYPLGTSLGLMVLGLVLVLLRRRRSGLLMLAVAILWLGLWSAPWFSDRVRLALEGRFSDEPVASLPTGDAVVVLGGGMRGATPGWTYPDLGAGGDRIWHAARIYHAGKAPLVILSGGQFAWVGARDVEAEAMGGFMRDLGVPAAALLVEGRSGNTRENALYSAELMRERGIERILLVTSALHMRRALGTFRAVGIDAVPAATDFEVTAEPYHPVRWLPDAEALAGGTRALKEYLGWWVYRARGWAIP
jgi:uncharacterized SAM-binding protein YcdF (DUF218 family)